LRKEILDPLSIDIREGQAVHVDALEFREK